MVASIVLLNQSDQNIAESILRVRSAAYKVEAYLLNQKDPTVKNDTVEEILENKNKFFGIYSEDQLAALICFIYDDVYQDVNHLDWRSYHYSQWHAYEMINQVQKTLESYHVNSGGRRVIVDTPAGVTIECERNNY